MNTLDLIAKHEIDIVWHKKHIEVFYGLSEVSKSHNGTDEDKARALREAIEEITG